MQRIADNPLLKNIRTWAKEKGIVQIDRKCPRCNIGKLWKVKDKVLPLCVECQTTKDNIQEISDYKEVQKKRVDEKMIEKAKTIMHGKKQKSELDGIISELESGKSYY